MHTAFEKYILENAGFADEKALAEIVGSSQIIALKKNDYLVREGQACPLFCYIESGILQHSITVDGNEKTTYLALRNSATSSLFSFLNQSPSRKDVRAIVDTKIFAFDLAAFRKLLEKNDLFRRFYYNLLERQICLIDDYRIDLLTMTPEERYRKLLATDPALLQSVPLHYLASFLGISMRHMSRIRKSAK
ncbi:MAG: Crp/Fnr family transcriptional regulator [Flavobacterium sp.]|nr:MAG: Crp/Fnr family transcriptional regulator [Flavobacterium sp.]